MPIYEYRRPDGSTFELVQAFSDDPLTHDPETGVKVQRVLHAPAVHFKGSGFYNTDYGTRKRQRETAASSAEASSSDSSSADSGASDNGKAGSSDGKAASSDGKSSTPSESKPKADKSAGSKSDPVASKS